jgi:nicotinamide mononucleotide (NMN) deamidase PncC
VSRNIFSGDREAVREQSVEKALAMLTEALDSAAASRA